MRGKQPGDTRVSGKGGAGGAPAARAEIQTGMKKTLYRKRN